MFQSGWNLVLELIEQVFHFFLHVFFSPSVRIDVKYNGNVIYFRINKWSPFLYYDFYPFPNHSFPYVKNGNTIALLDQHNVTMHQHGKKPIKTLLSQKKSFWPSSFFFPPSYFSLIMLSAFRLIFSGISQGFPCLPIGYVESNCLVFCLLIN